MASICREYLITTRGKNYIIGDDIIMKLKNGVLLVGIIEKVVFKSERGYFITLLTPKGEVEIPIDLIED